MYAIKRQTADHMRMRKIMSSLKAAMRHAAALADEGQTGTAQSEARKLYTDLEKVAVKADKLFDKKI